MASTPPAALLRRQPGPPGPLPRRAHERVRLQHEQAQLLIDSARRLCANRRKAKDDVSFLVPRLKALHALAASDDRMPKLFRIARPGTVWDVMVGFTLSGAVLEVVGSAAKGVIASCAQGPHVPHSPLPRT